MRTDTPKRLVHAIVLAACIASGSRILPAAEDRPPKEPASAAAELEVSGDWTGKVLLLEIKGDEGIMWDRRSLIKEKVEKVFKRVKREPPRLVVVEIDSPGGSVNTCDDLSKLLKECQPRTVGLVVHKAVSGGTVIATACNEIVMVKGSRIGDVKPILMLPFGAPAQVPDDLREKIERDVITLLESNAEANGHSVQILQAMVTPSIELYEIRFADSSREFLTTKQVEVLEENVKSGRDKRKIVDKQIVCEAGRLLELTAEKDVQYGLAKKVVSSREAFFQENGIAETDLVVAEVTDDDVEVTSFFGKLGGEELSTVELLLLGLFLAVGIAGILTEIHIPGFGIPGALGIIGFVCFFALLVLHGNAAWYEIGLFLVGIILLIVEIVVLPGFGVIGISGILCILAGLFLAFTPSFGTPYMAEHIWDEAARFVLLLGGVIFAVSVFGYLAVTYGSRIPFLRYFYLTTTLRSGAEVREEARADSPADTTAAEEACRAFVGKAGVATTQLRPAGKVRLDQGSLVDVVTEGGLIEAGQRIVVLDARVGRIVVGPEAAGGARAGAGEDV